MPNPSGEPENPKIMCRNGQSILRSKFMRKTSPKGAVVSEQGIGICSMFGSEIKIHENNQPERGGGERAGNRDLNYFWCRIPRTSPKLPKLCAEMDNPF